MVKRQKEKQYQSTVEHRLNAQIRSGRLNSSSTRPLPFNCCALTLTPFTQPVCCYINNNNSSSSNDNSTNENYGIIFENSAVIPYLLKHKHNPVSGTPMSSRDIITLNMDKNEETNQWQCPILNKPFMNHSKIVAIKHGSEANVYLFEAVQTLNFKAKNYVDLISGFKFDKKKDVILLQDPENVNLNKTRDIQNFVHTKVLRDERQQGSSSNSNIKMSVSASRVMDKLKQKEEIRLKEKLKKRKASSENEANDQKDTEKKKTKILTSDLGITLTTGKTTGSFTSTSMPQYRGEDVEHNDAREATQEEILQSQFLTMKSLKKKGYVRVTTNLGTMDIELHCDIAPRTCTNFIGLCEKGEYDNTTFHRSIRNFMIQGGSRKSGSSSKNKDNPESTETSLWGEPFPDEFDDRLKHVGPGCVSMANAGPGTNKRQFFITFKSASHLDRKHSIFGRVIKGLDVLRVMENSPTDKKDRPRQEITILNVKVYLNPVTQAENIESKKIRKRKEERESERQERKASALGQTTSVRVPVINEGDTSSVLSSQSKSSKTHTHKVGIYIKQQGNVKKRDIDEANSDSVIPSRLPQPPKKTTFGDFSGW
mmetsp:Transcript_20228/g.22912  ORF Transcript_20228/g.22912 Transcript_20228/m.22912 type:complete len:596 (-) Transcript_20228:93-1880(-)